MGFQQPWAETCVAVGVLASVALASYWVAKQILLKALRAAFAKRSGQADHASFLRFVRRLANLPPAFVLEIGIGSVPRLAPWFVSLVRNVALGVMIVVAAIAISAALDWLNHLYARRPNSRSRPIKGYLQVAKIAVFSAAAILTVAVLIDRSPVVLLSGLGAMAAVLLLVFKDTILSLVASVQLTSNDMIRVGDWIEMPGSAVDGDVIDIALHTVKVQNFDKTIVTIPTHRLISEPFRNWRGMVEAGGRRIKRSLPIDQNSVRMIEGEELERFRRFSLLRDYIARKEAELADWNSASEDRLHDAVNARRLTNIGTFRAYISAYLRSHDDISNEMFLLVRQLPPSELGLPIEIYGFTATTEWAEYEDIQGDLFDHLLAILPEFGLRIFQRPSGVDVAQALKPAT